MSKLVAFLLLSLFTSQNSTQENSPCGNWTAFKDEKCYKLFNHVTTWTEASNYCLQQDKESTLVIIKTKEEQDAIVKILKVSDVADNIWIGITRKNGTFKNADQTDLDFKNWADNRPVLNTSGLDCVDLSTDIPTYGKWFDEKCQKQNAVICQKIQPWSSTILQNELLDMKREFKKELDIQKELSKELDLQKQKLINLEQKANQMEQNPVPIGFIYVQMLNQSEPKTLWPNTEWQNISPKLAGLFFRVEGGDASAFGQIQSQQTQTIVVMSKHESPNYKDPLIIGTEFQNIYSGSNSGTNYYLHLKHNEEEIRPKNSAIRVWQRIK